MAKNKDVEKEIQRLEEEVLMDIPAGSMILTPEAFAKLSPEDRKHIEALVAAGQAVKFTQPTTLIDKEDFEELTGIKPPEVN